MKICKIHGIKYEELCPSCEHEKSYLNDPFAKRKISAYRHGLFDWITILWSDRIDSPPYLEGQYHRHDYKKLGILVEKGE